MKMGFLLKNNARKRMGEKRSAQKGRGKGVLKKGEKKEAEKRPPKFANSKTDGRVGRKFANFEGWGKLCFKTSGLAPMLS